MSHRQICDCGLFADDGVWFTTLGPHWCFALLGHWRCFKREDIQDCLLIQVIDNHVCKVHEFPDTCQCFHVKPGAVQILVSNKSHASPSTQQQSQVYWIKYSHGAYSSPCCSDPFRWAQASSQELAQVRQAGIPACHSLWCPSGNGFLDAFESGFCTGQKVANNQPEAVSVMKVELVHFSACKDAVTRAFISGSESSGPLCGSEVKQSKLPAASRKADCHNKDLTRILLSLARKKDAV